MRNNTHVQIIGIGHTYQGSLVNVESEIPQAYFGFSQNLIEDNVFLGSDTRLIEISGPVMNIQSNVMINNGYLSPMEVTNNTA